MRYYGVKIGRTIGVFTDLDACKESVYGYPRGVFKRFNNYIDAGRYVFEDEAIDGYETSSVASSENAYTDSYDSNDQYESYDNYEQSLSEESDYSYERYSDSETGYSDDYLYQSLDICDICDMPDFTYLEWVWLEDYEPRRPIDYIAYVDGCCVRNGRWDAVAGFGVYWEWRGANKPDLPQCSKRVIGPQTNNNAELSAILYVLNVIRNLCDNGRTGYSFVIASDSQYACKCITEYSRRWAYNGWTNASGNPVSNSELIRRINQNICYIEQNVHTSITIAYVPGHTDFYGNEMADYLARKSAYSNDPKSRGKPLHNPSSYREEYTHYIL